MNILVLSLATGLMVHAWIRDSGDWWPGLAWGIALPSGSSWLMLSSILAGWGLGQVSQAIHYETLRDRDEQQAELVLRQIGRLLPQRGSLSMVMDDLVQSGIMRPENGRDAEWLLSQLTSQWNVEAFSMVGEVARRARLHGGSLEPVIDQAIRKIARDRRQRFQRQIDESAKRLTIEVLAVAPYFVLVLFFVSIPSFYGSMINSLAGHVVLVSIGTVTAVALWVLSLQVRKRGDVR